VIEHKFLNKKKTKHKNQEKEQILCLIEMYFQRLYLFMVIYHNFYMKLDIKKWNFLVIILLIFSQPNLLSKYISRALVGIL